MTLKNQFASRLSLGLLAAVFGFAGGVDARQNSVETLYDAVSASLDYQPELQARWNAYRAAQQDRREAFGAYLPSLDLNANAGRANKDFDGRGQFNRGDAEVALTQVLFAGGRIHYRVAQMTHTEKVRYLELLEEAQLKALETTQAYLDVQRYRQTVALAEQNLRDHQAVHQHIEQRVSSGVANRADLMQISGRVSLAQANLMTELANLQNVSMRFQRIVGQMPPASLAPVSDPAQAVPQALTTALGVAYAHNPGLHATFENIEAAQSAKKVAQSRYYPTLELGARHGVYQNTNGFDGRIDRDRNGEESVVELRARYNLFRGMSDRAADNAAAYRVSQSQDLRDKACVDLRQTLAIAHNDVLNVQFKLRALESHRSNAVNVITAYREQFDAGRRSLLDVLDAQNEAFQAERALINGRFDLSTAQARTLQSMGTLLDVLSARPDTLADATQDDGGARAQNYCTAFAAQDMNMQTQLTEVLQAPAPIAPAAQVVPVVTEKAFVVQGDALFDSGSATLGAQAIAALKPLLDQLQQAAQVRMIEITGHTDSLGHAARNQTLSEARAQSVKAYLIQAGVDAALIQTHGVAATQPLADNATAAGRAQNRRVEIRVQMTQP